MKTIKDYNGNNIDFEAAVMLMESESSLTARALKTNRNFTTRIAKSITRSTTKNLKSKSKRANARLQRLAALH